MLTATARKHIIAAIRRAILCSHQVAAEIVDLNWARLKSIDCDMRFANVTVDYNSIDDFSGYLNLWAGKNWKAIISVPAGGMRVIATTTMEEAYAERPNPNLPSITGIVTNSRVHPDAPGCVLIDVLMSDVPTKTLTLLPLPWHAGDDLLNYARWNDGRTAKVIYHNAAASISEGEELPAGISPTVDVAEFIIPVSDDQPALAA
jgi:hypothetical protein